MDVSAIDKNLILSELPEGTDVELHPVPSPKISLYGVSHTPDGFVRLPHELAPRVNTGVGVLYRNTAGGRLRFKTDSPYLVITALARGATDMSHMARVGSSGFDFYIDGNFRGSFIALWRREGDLYRYTAMREIGSGGEVLIHLPLYNDLLALSVGIKPGSTLDLPDTDYLPVAPVVYYGSSITQGGCASRPGMSYQAILSRRLNVDHINLGFSGSAHGEIEIAEYIASLKMSAFVLDYDHNAPTVKHLEKTHQPFFDCIRRAQPTLPIILLSRPTYRMPENDRREAVIYKTYTDALARGDENVYFISGRELMADALDEGTVDNCHPTDLGFWSMANSIEPTLRKVLGL